MKITLELPDAKFAVGDIVRRQNYNNTLGVFVLIVSRIANGNWQILDNGKLQTSVEVEIIGSSAELDHYMCSIQEGSNHDIIANDISFLRPGTVLMLQRAELDEIGVKVEWDKPIIQPDDLHNVFQRDKDWRNK